MNEDDRARMAPCAILVVLDRLLADPFSMRLRS